MPPLARSNAAQKQLRHVSERACSKLASAGCSASAPGHLQEKLGLPEHEQAPTVREMVRKFVEGLCWVMKYYYEGGALVAHLFQPCGIVGAVVHRICLRGHVGVHSWAHVPGRWCKMQMLSLACKSYKVLQLIRHPPLAPAIRAHSTVAPTIVTVIQYPAAAPALAGGSPPL